MKNSMSGGAGGKCSGATLSIVNEELVGMGPVGHPLCQGTELEGATFEIRSWKYQGDPKVGSLRVLIEHVGTYEATDIEKRTAYFLALADQRGVSLCAPDASKAARLQLGLKPLTGLGGPPQGGTDMAIPLSSELYNVQGIPIQRGTEWHGNGVEWLNLACVGDALAKRSLYQLYSATDVAKNRAAMGMLTANYCGDRPLTVRGTRFRWKPCGQTTGVNVEARWTEKGASCLYRPRALYRASDVESIPPELEDICVDAHNAPMKCANLDEWKRAARRCSDTESLPATCAGDICVFESEPVLPSEPVTRSAK